MRGGNNLYVIQMAVTGDVKIGRTSDIARRMGEIQTGCPHPLRLILHAPGLGPREKGLHRLLRRYQCRQGHGEWFSEDCLGELPTNIYEMIPITILEDIDWWIRE